MIQLDIPSNLLIRNRSHFFVSRERPVLGIDPMGTIPPSGTFLAHADADESSI